MTDSHAPERAERVRALFDEALDLDADARTAYFDQACDDDSIRREVERLLQAHDQRAGGLHQALDRLFLAPQPDVPGASVEPDPDPPLGPTPSRYQILKRLGRGGMGVVYQARDTKLDRTVALKFLPPHLGFDEESKQRFIHEAKAASALDHANICTIHDIDETDQGRLFIAMAYYAGETLRQKIARGPLPVGEARDYAAQVAEGLSRAHEAGIVHRDVKPANVMVTERGRAKIVDFGLAKVADVSLTQTGTTLGTVSYMSPEQALGQAVDHRTDLWSLGVVLYEMLTGERPFGGGHAQSILYRIRHDEPEAVRALRPEVPEAVSQVVAKLLKKDPAERYQRAEEVLVDLGVPRRESEAMRPKARPASVRSTRRSRLLHYGGVALIGLVLALVGYDQFSGRGAPLDSIAVLPLKNFTGNPDQEYVADGMTEELIDKLGRIKALRRVISRTTAMRFKDTDKSLPEIGRELDVAVIVEGSLRAFGEQVQIDVRLIDARTEERLWAERFTQASGNVLMLHNEVARVIAREVAVTLTAQEEARLAAVSEVNPAAYDFYLQGLRARAENPEERHQAIAYFEQAVALDSSFAPAYAGLAIEYALGADFQRLPDGEVKARRYAEQALWLDPSASEPHIAIGLVREFLDWDWTGAEESFLQALDRNPGDAFAHHELGTLWTRLRRFEEAIAMEKQALYLDPLSARYQSGLGEAYLYSGQYDKAIDEFKAARALNPNVGAIPLGMAYWETDQYEEALQLWETIGWSEQARAKYYAVTGQPEKALVLLEDWKARLERGEPMFLYTIAWIYACLGEKDLALDWLELAYEQHEAVLIFLNIEPDFDSLHDEPRFQALLAKMGFP